jgi:hypothetical protein
VTNVAKSPEPIGSPKVASTKYIPATAASHRASPLRRGDRPELRAVVLLGGSVRPSHFSTIIGRSLLDLPVDAGKSVMDHWAAEIAALADAVGKKALPMRVLVDQNSPAPSPRISQDPRVLVSIEMDPASFRGTGGLLRDLAQQYEDDDFILVTSAAKILLSPLADLMTDLARATGDVRLIVQDDGTPTNSMLVRCACLREISPVGFVDFKEQALPSMAAKFRISTVRRPPSGLGFRNLQEYIRGLRVLRQIQSCGPMARIDAFAEDWRSTFSLVEDGAAVASHALIHDSVVLRGSRVESGATLVRSIVCPGGVARGAQVYSESALTVSGLESPTWDA